MVKLNRMEIMAIFQNIAIFTFAYTVYNNSRQLELEKKRYWYREHIVKNLFPYMDEIRGELERYVEIKSKFLSSKKDFKLKKKERMKVEKMFWESTERLKDKILKIENKIEILEYFVPALRIFQKNNILSVLMYEVNRFCIKIFNENQKLKIEEINDFYIEFKRKIYMYENEIIK